MAKPKTITEDHIDLMHYVQSDGSATQRQMAQNTGLSIGKVNYCIKALINIGYIKIQNFNNSNHKLQYAYVLTLKGIREKTLITKKFIIKKKKEYDKLVMYIK